ncbi:MAG TPA: HAD family hydrolase [Ignisphaera aggregans]|uniref:HAD family hydrolase n=1 Tax=Ignisphaera aggregans TaxID=334771 RepID=A0A832YZB7_9CREN|nr:HAD family hydrolase [Ignisphaera aggregans]
MLRVLSLDFAGVIAPKDFIDYFWFVALPRRIAKLEKIPLYEAMKFVERAYETVSRNTLEWYLPQYWALRFGVEDLLEDAIHESLSIAEVYGDALELIPMLATRYTLVIATNTPRSMVLKFLDKYPTIGKCIKRVYSCIDDLRVPRKDREFYIYMLRDLGIKPTELLHVGDDPLYDGAIPRELGIKAIVIDRRSRCGKYLRDLYQLVEELGG